MAQPLKRLTYLPDITAFPEQEVFYKMGLWVPENRVPQLVTPVNQAFLVLNAVTSGYGSIDLDASRIHKAWGLQRVMDPLGLTLVRSWPWGQ
ncbi:hypothetical protein [Streptococcus sp.]|uniref:hypothetical protein n=1 Tax=Streptococcus sp. TaxID=1306 RepID=UPI00391A18E3